MREFCLKAGLLLILLGGIITFVVRYDIVALFNEPVDIFAEELQNADEIKPGMAIDTDMYMLLECFGSKETTSKNRAGQVTSTSTTYYYILPVFVGEDETYFIALSAGENSDNISTYNKMANETMDYLTGYGDTYGSYTLHIEGSVQKLEDDGYELMKDWFEDSGYYTNDADIEKYVLPYVMTARVGNGVYIMIGVGIGGIILGILLVFIYFFSDRKYASRRKQLNKLQDKTLNINGVTLNVARLDDVDKLIFTGKKEKAARVLVKSYGANETQAQQIVENWGQITGIPL